MTQKDKTKEELIEEISLLQKRIAELEAVDTERKKAKQVVKEARKYAESIVETVRGPLIVLDAGLKVISANHSFYQTFKVNPEETQGRFIYDLGNRQWDIPKLRTLLEDILPKNSAFDSYEIEHDFETVGPKTMLLNARRLDTVQMVLLAIEDITERKQTEEEIKNLAKFPEENSNPVYRASKDGVLLYANPASRRLILGDQIKIGDKIPEKWIGMIKNVYDSGKKQQAEIELSGRVFLFDMVPVIEGGYVNSYATDITERKRAEESLRESQDRYRALVENTVLGVTVIDTNYKIIMANSMIAKLFNRPVSDFVGKNCFREYEKREAVCSHCPGAQAMASGKTTEVETQGVRDDGSRFYVRNRAIPLFRPDGVAKGFIELVEDITERKQAEKYVQETNDKIISMANQVSNTMKAVSEKGGSAEYLRFENPNLVRCHEVKNCTKTGCPIYNNAEPTRCWETVGTFCNGEAQGVFAKKLKDCRKCEVYKQARREPLFDLGESFNEMMLILEYRQQNLEKALKDISQAKKEAEAANEAKSQFLANMSHEIRTPLNSIIGFSEILMQEELAEEHKEHLRIVYNSGKHLLRLIGDILDFSRIEAGKMNIEMEQCSLGQLIAKIESMMQPFATEKGLTFEIREKGDLPANIATDAAHLQQCLINLVNNAIKFTEQGHIYVNISLEDKDSKPRIRFEVEDTGTGIAPESQQKIFEPFVQEDGSTSRKYGGTGLGLTITRKLAELLGGELTLTSEKGKGSVFSLVIPAGVDLATQPLLERQKISDDTSTDTSEAKHARFSGCVLVTEDVKSNQMFMKALLERMGLKITIAENGAEAVDKALGQKFDLIFMDIQMPQVNGYEATRILRSKGIKTPIVALTAGAMEGDDKKCIEAGCDDYLSKPIEHSKLIEALSKYLENDALPKDGDFTVKSDNDKVNENYLSQTDAPDNEEVIDWAQMVAHGLDEQSMKEIIPTYVNDNKEHLRGLISAVKTSNAKDVQSHAHAIKGAGRNLGAARLSELAGQLETMALKEDLSEAEELLKDITSEFHRLEEFISRPDWIEIAKEQATNRLELGSNRKSS
jgi:PAS domain S-box-containing protein